MMQNVEEAFHCSMVWVVHVSTFSAVCYFYPVVSKTRVRTPIYELESHEVLKKSKTVFYKFLLIFGLFSNLCRLVDYWIIFTLILLLNYTEAVW